MSQPRRRRNVAKMLSRLNPKSMPLEFTGSSSTAGAVETAIDIAAALGAAGSWGSQERAGARRLAVLALCLRWWPSLFEGPMQVVGHRAVTRTVKRLELCRDESGNLTGERDHFMPHPVREGSYRPAKREVVTTTETTNIPVEMPSESDSFRLMASLIATRMRLRIQRDRQLQSRGYAVPLPDNLVDRVLNPAFLDPWSRAVIHEYRHPNVCPMCLGYGESVKIGASTGNKVKVTTETCSNCIGQGVLAWSVKRRARALCIGEHPWRDYLNDHHNGALSLLRELEYRGAILVIKHLGAD